MSINIIPFNDNLFSLDSTEGLSGCNGRNFPFNNVSGLESKTNYRFRLVSAPKSNVVKFVFDEERGQTRHIGESVTTNPFGDFRQGYDPRVDKDVSSEGDIGFVQNLNETVYKIFQLDNSNGTVLAKGTSFRWVPGTNRSTLYCSQENGTFENYGNTSAGVIFQNYDFESSFVSWGSSIQNIFTINHIYDIVTQESEDNFGDIPQMTTGLIPINIVQGTTIRASGYIFVKALDSGNNLFLTVHLTNPGSFSVGSVTNYVVESTQIDQSNNLPCFRYKLGAANRLDIDANANSFKRIEFKESGFDGTQYTVDQNQKVYQWDYTSIDPNDTIGNDTATKIEADVYSWIPSQSALYIRLCIPNRDFEVRFGAVIQYGSGAILGNKGINLTRTELTPKTLRFVNLAKHLSFASTPQQNDLVYSASKQYIANWNTPGETLAQTLSRENFYVPGFDYIPGQKVIQVQKINTEGNVEDYQYALGTVISWTVPNLSDSSDFSSMKLVVRIDRKGPPRLGSTFSVEDFDDLSTFRVGSLIDQTETNFPAEGKIIPYSPQVLEDLKKPESEQTFYPNWPYNINNAGNVFFTSQKQGVFIGDDGFEEFSEKSEVPVPTTIGTGRIRCISINPNVASTEVYPLYKFHIFDTNLFENDGIFGDITHIAYRHFEEGQVDPTKTFTKRIVEIANISGKEPVVTLLDGETFITRKTKIFDPKKDQMFLPLTAPTSDKIFESVIGGENTISFEIQKIYNVLFNGAQTTAIINVSDGSSPVSSDSRFLIEEPGINWYVIDVNTGESMDLYQDKPSLEENEMIYSLGSTDGQSLSLTRNTSSQSREFLLIAKVATNVNISNIKTKQLSSKKELLINALERPRSGKYKGKFICEFMKQSAYGVVKNIQSVYVVDSSERIVFGTGNIKDQFELDYGVSDQKFNRPKLVLKSSNVNADGTLSSSVFGTGTESVDPSSVNLEITYTLYKFDNFNSPGIFVKESYGESVSLEDIPFYQSPNTGEIYHESSLIDFRPNTFSDLSEQTLGDTKFVPHPDWSDAINTSFYLPRKDRLILTRNGRFEVVYGTPSVNPVFPQEPTNSMTLNLIQKPSYLFSVKDANIINIDNRRYTMKDIGRIDKRVQKLEYYTSLSLLEANAESFLILDENGNNRFKSGILVDNFSGHGIGDVLNPDYNISVDQNSQYCRPPFKTHNSKMVFDPQSDNDTSRFRQFFKSGLSTGIFTFPFSVVPFAAQPLASRSISVMPHEVVDWEGRNTLFPSSDIWVDETRNPDVLVNIAGNNDAWQALASSIGPFGVHWNSWQSIGQTSNSQFSSTTTIENGWQNTITSQTTTTNTQQQRTGSFNELIATEVQNSLGTRVADVNIIPFMRQQSIQIISENLKPNTRMYVFFDGIPVSEFCTLYSTLSDLQNNINGISFATGNPNDLRTSSDGKMYIRFNLPGGTFRTGEKEFDLTDHPSNNRSRASSYATAKYFSNGLGITREEVILTTRDFEVITQSTTESRTVASSSRTVTDIQRQQLPRRRGRDPLAQTFFVNEELHPEGIYIQSVDLFYARKPENNPDLTTSIELRPVQNGYPDSVKVYPGSVVTVPASEVNVSATPDANDPSTKTTFVFDYPIYLAPGEHALVIKGQTEDFEVYIAELGENILNTNVQITNQPYDGVFFTSANASTWSPDQNSDVMMIMNKCEFETGKEFVLPLRNAQTTPEKNLFETLFIQSNFIDFNSCRVSWNAKLYPLVSINNVEQYTILPNTNTVLTKQYAYGQIGNSQVPVKLELVSSTSNPDVCPLIDIQRLGFLAIHNIVDSNDSQDNGETLPYSNPLFTNTRARYISRIVTLEDGFESSNLRVTITLNKPKNTNIQVFGKTQSAYSTNDFHSNEYVRMNPISESFFAYESSTENEWTEFTFELPNETSEPFNKFCIKLCLYSTNFIDIPKVTDMRAIAII
jgi:hypothetical protein